MKKTVTMTIGEFFDRFSMRDNANEIVGLHPYCLNEGRATKEDTINITEKQWNKLGLSKYEFEARAK